MFNEQTIIELREVNAHVNNAPGDYQIALKEGIPIQSGDTLEIKSAYIDSVEASSGDIIVQKDTNVKLSFVPYIMNWIESTDTERPAPEYITPTGTQQPDIHPYFACEKSIVAPASTTYAVAELTIYRDSATRNGGAWGRNPDTGTSLILTWKFTSPADVISYRNIVVPYNTGKTDKLVMNVQTNPELFPWFIKGDKTTPWVSVQITQDSLNGIKIIDNVNNITLMAGNQTPSIPPIFTDIYGSFKRISSWQVTRNNNDAHLGPLNASHAVTFQYRDWKDGLTKTHKVTFGDIVDQDTFIIVFDPYLDVIGGSQVASSSQPCDAANSIKFLSPQPFPGSASTGSSSLIQIPPNIKVGSSGDTAFFMQVFGIADVDMGLVAHMKVLDETYLLKAGSYPVAELCEILTDNFSSLTLNGNTFTKYPTNNKFLMTNNQLRELNSITGGDRQYYVRDDGQGVLSFGDTPTADPFIGTDQVAFVADAVLNKVKIQAIHSAIYDTGSAGSTFTPVVKYANVGSNQSVIVGKNGGVVFTAMEPQSFWEQLGFLYDDENRIFDTPIDQAIVINGQDILTQSIQVTPGRFTTDALSGLNNALIKASPYIFNGLPALNATPGSIIASKEIVATNSISQAGDNDGYFMIEVGGIPKSDVVGAELETDRIHSIVSRFYQSGNFTTAYNEGSISVQYRGEPTILSNFSVRILNADGDVTNDVQSKSCIFLQLTRAEAQPPQ